MRKWAISLEDLISDPLGKCNKTILQENYFGMLTDGNPVLQDPFRGFSLELHLIVLAT